MPLAATKHDGNVLVVEVARPDRGNALNGERPQEPSSVWQESEASEEDLR